MGRRLAACAAALIVSGCANQAGSRMGFFSASAPVIAVMAGDLLVGEAEGSNMRGRIEVRSVVSPQLRCMGSFEYEGWSHGVGKVRCTDGAEAAFDFKALSVLSGHGIGTSARGPFSFTYGLTPEESEQYLTLPPSKRLGKQGGELRLLEL